MIIAVSCYLVLRFFVLNADLELLQYTLYRLVIKPFD